MERHDWILLVEDNEDDIELLHRSLERQNIRVRVVTARDGAEALAILRDGPSGSGPRNALKRLPSLVLLDINLPEISGLTVLERIRAEALTRLLRVVVLSTSDHASDLTRAYANGANSYVRKPVDFAEFQETVHAIGRYWLGLNEPRALLG